MKREHSRIALFIFALAVLGGLFFLGRLGGFSSEYSASDPALNAVYWTEQIQSRGAEAAYADFKSKNAETVEKQRHLSAHVIGEKIFEIEGVSGIGICDASFGFGCFHGFFGRALSSEGEDVIGELDRICVEKFGPLGTGCQHGIGHGVLEYVGYQNISSALAMCGATTQKTPLLGCVSGVFMEYNSPLVGISDGLAPAPRALDEKQPYTPCKNVADEYQKSCYFELGGWLQSVFPQSYEESGKFCESAPHEYRPYCALGFGASVPHMVGYDMKKSRMACDAFIVGTKTACRAGVAWGFYTDPVYRGNTLTACELENQTDTAECLSFADLTEGLGSFPK